MRKFLLAVLVLALSGCVTSKTHLIDSRGRDCWRTVTRAAGIPVSQSDECSEFVSPVAPQPSVASDEEPASRKKHKFGWFKF